MYISIQKKQTHTHTQKDSLSMRKSDAINQNNIKRVFILFSVCVAHGSLSHINGGLFFSLSISYTVATDVPCGIDFATIQSKFGHGTTSSSASKSSSSSSSVRNPRIINGVEADRFEFPWIVSFQYKKSGRHFCSGFVINRRYVLSALHCFQDGDMAVGYTFISVYYYLQCHYHPISSSSASS